MFTRSDLLMSELSEGAMALLTPKAPGAVIFGVQGVDRSESSYWDLATNRGKAEFDLAFDLSDPNAQEKALRVAAAIRAAPCPPESCTETTTTFAEPLVGVRFFLEEMQSFHNGSLPAHSDFEPALQAWLADDGLPYSEQVGFVDGRLRFARIDFRVGVSLMGAKYSDVKAVHDYGVDLTQSELAGAPSGLRSAEVSLYARMPNPETGVEEMIDILCLLLIQPYLYHTLKVNLLGCYAFCFVILATATRGFRLAFMTCLTTASVVAVLLGRAYVRGQGLDMPLLVTTTVVVGFSFDYTMHMCMSVIEAKGHTRSDKAANAVGNLGPTLVGAAATTIGALFPMFFTEARLLQLLGGMVSIAILASFSLSILLFLPAYVLCGPAPLANRAPEVVSGWWHIARSTPRSVMVNIRM